MSIIYEALKKTQRKLKISAGKDKKKKSILKFYIALIFLALIGCSFALTILLYNPIIPEKLITKNYTESTQSQKMIIQKSWLKNYEENSHKFVLTGIVTMNDEKIALINDKMVKKGDYIEGASVIDILDDRVYLNLSGKPILLKIK
jgi:hypothetical protein